jgi:hypothetical protein
METTARRRRRRHRDRAARPLNRRRLLVALGALLLGAGGCDFLDEEPELAEFIFAESTHGVTVEPSIDVADIGASIAIVGQLNTPTPCHRLRASLDHSGSQLTLRVVAQPTTGTCDNVIGNFRYQGVIRNLADGTYQFRVQHSFDASSWEPYEFNVSVTVR